MSLIFLMVTAIVGLLIGAGFLYISVRFLFKSPCTFGRMIGVYLAMVVTGSIILWAIFYAATSMVRMHAVPSLILAMTLASLAECAAGNVLLKKTVSRALFAVAIPVVVLNLIATLELWQVVKSVEKKAQQASVMNGLRQYYLNVNIAMQDQGGEWPESLAAIAAPPYFHSGNIPATDLDYLPEQLTRAGIKAPYGETELNSDFPFIWIKTGDNEDVPVVYVDGSCLIVKRPELDAQVKSAIENVTLRRNGG